jgi:hypothetical protein
MVDVLPDTLSGVAGWVAFATSSGVLYWYLRVRTPAIDAIVMSLITGAEARVAAKDAQIDTLLKTQAITMQEMSKAHVDALACVAQEFKTAVQANAEHFDKIALAQSEHCEREITRLISLFEERDSGRHGSG